MSEKKKTVVLIVLDRSGSMHDVREQALNGYNDQIRAAIENAKDQDIKVCLVSFGTEVFEHYWLQDASESQIATQGDYICDGWTALYDAWGYGIEKLQETTNQNDPDIAYMVYVITDGAENKSTHFKGPDLFSKIATLQNTGKWTFAPMCSSMAQMQEIAAATNIPASNFAVCQMARPSQAKAAYGTSGQRSRKFYAARASGQSAVANFYNDSLEACADFSDADAGDADAGAAAAMLGGRNVRTRGGAQNMAFSAKSMVSACAVNDSVAATPEVGGSKIFTSGGKVAWKV